MTLYTNVRTLPQPKNNKQQHKNTETPFGQMWTGYLSTDQNA